MKNIVNSLIVFKITVPESILPENPPKVKGFLEKQVLAIGLRCAGGVALFGEVLYVVDAHESFDI